ncbi:MAG: tyrosine-protein phosphatase [Gaiellaceae bacterium]
MIDIHCHMLPGLDDGPSSEDESVELARAAVATGTRAVVATPHIRSDHPFAHERIEELAARLRERLAAEGVELELLTGGEIALSELDLIDEQRLRDLALGTGDCLLVESPYGQVGELLEGMLADLRRRGFRPVLAHPERAPAFQEDPARLARLVEKGVLTSITAASMEGRFGKPARRMCVQMLKDGLVHDVASDAHSARGRPPGLAGGFQAMSDELRGLEDHATWYVRDAPAAMVSGRPLPPRPPSPGGRSAFFRRR